MLSRDANIADESFAVGVVDGVVDCSSFLGTEELPNRGFAILWALETGALVPEPNEMPVDVVGLVGFFGSPLLLLGPNKGLTGIPDSPPTAGVAFPIDPKALLLLP